MPLAHAHPTMFYILPSINEYYVVNEVHNVLAIYIYIVWEAGCGNEIVLLKLKVKLFPLRSLDWKISALVYNRHNKFRYLILTDVAFTVPFSRSVAVFPGDRSWAHSFMSLIFSFILWTCFIRALLILGNVVVLLKVSSNSFVHISRKSFMSVKRKAIFTNVFVPFSSYKSMVTYWYCEMVYSAGVMQQWLNIHNNLYMVKVSNVFVRWSNCA